MDEEAKQKQSALQNDIQKLMKAIVAQRKQIETLEKDKLEQMEENNALQSAATEAKEIKKELESYKRQRVDLLDKTGEYDQ